MTKVLVTGASGFIGKYLVPELGKEQFEIFTANSTQGDIADETTWAKFPPADVVIHLAARSFVPDSWNDPSGFIQCNLMGTIAALNYCKKHNAKLVFLSSYLYGKPEILPIPETAPISATNPYALSKMLAEDACRFYADVFGLSITVLRLFNIYGPGQSLSFLIPTILKFVDEQSTIKVKDLEPKRDYVYIKDLVRAIILSVNYKSAGFNVFNIGSGTSYSVDELIKAIQELKKTDLAVYSEEVRRKEEIMDTVADIEKAGKYLGWVPQYSLRQGLQEFLT